MIDHNHSRFNQKKNRPNLSASLIISIKISAALMFDDLRAFCPESIGKNSVAFLF